MRVGLVGAGRAGRALALLLVRAGWPVTTIASRTPAHARALALQTGAQDCGASATAALAGCDVLLLAVPDDAIAGVAALLAGEPLSGKAVVHLSGALSLEPLAVLHEGGAHTGSLHPVYPFSDAPPESLAGVAFALEASDDGLLATLQALVAALGGQALYVPPGQKRRYHLALTLASNYTITLAALAQNLLTRMHIEPQAARMALSALVSATAENLRVRGLPAALTGPVSRGDLGTIQGHLDALRESPADGELLDLYRLLGTATVPLYREMGGSEATARSMERLFKGEAGHAQDRP